MRMRIRFEMRHRAAIIFACLVIFIDYYLFFGRVFFVPVIVLALTLAWLPQWLDVFEDSRKQKELESKFPEFVRNLTGAIKSGMPAAQSVIHVSDADYGSLSPYIKKLANQIEWSIPFHTAFFNFGRETNNTVIKRAIATMTQAEEAGGNMEDVLGSITESLMQIKKIKEERKTSIQGQIMQNYVIFFVFLGVMIMIQNFVIPYMAQFAGSEEGVGGVLGGMETSVSIDLSDPISFVGSVGKWAVSLHGLFLMMSIIQGFFAGVVLGKLAEGDLSSGLKHSLIMSTFAVVAITLSQGFL
jgi:archaeal flagellar protein FlaJ